MRRHEWTYQENEICCKRYLEHFVLTHSGLSASELVRLIKAELPHLKENSIRRKISNIKFLSTEAHLDDSMTCAASSNCSNDNKKAFQSLLQEYGII